MNLFRLFRHPKELVDLTPDALEARLTAKLLLIDVRTTREYAAGHIHQALSMPLGHEAEVARKWPADTDVVLICKTGHRSQAAAQTLLSSGFLHISHLKGGMDAWRRAGKPVES